jgi:hypothetical protein
VAVAEDPGAFCRDVETYLCRKNDGHLVRIVGPAFEEVLGWAQRGIPLKVVFRGIDRYFERYYAKGPQRRPVRVEFCRADVLDVFDEWRRSVGIGELVSDPSEPAEEGSGRPRESLARHLEKVVARLTMRRGAEDRSLDGVLDAIVRELDTVRAGAKGLRGEAREALLDRLRTLDGTLLSAARQTCDAATLRELTAEADAQLAPFKDRMTADVYAESRQAAIDRLIRDHRQLPAIAFD